MATNTLAADRHELLTTTLTETTETCWIVDPTPEMIEAVVDVASDGDTAGQFRLLAAEDTLKTTFEEFLVASRTADLVADNDLAVRTVGAANANSLVITESAVTAVVAAGEQVAGLRTDDPEFVEITREEIADRWADAEAFRLRTPAISEIRTTLSDDIGPAVREDFDTVVRSLETADDDIALDEVAISLVIAAKNEVLLYDISKWGEDVGIASKATFSRTKSRLEDANVITTEKVPIDVGRPRLRLQLGDDQLKTAPTTDLAAVAAELLD
jgi:hypothetical protein